MWIGNKAILYFDDFLHYISFNKYAYIWFKPFNLYERKSLTESLKIGPRGFRSQNSPTW